MNSRLRYYLFFLIVFLTMEMGRSYAQTDSSYTYDANGVKINTSSSKGDTLQHRDPYADSITIFFKYFDSTKNHNLDIPLNDFSKRLGLPYYYNTLGNFGTAATSMIFNPFMKIGWDEGMHQFDVYNYTLENTRLFQTTRPYTELGYILGSKSEQIIDILHTQNKKDNFNFSFEYRFSNAPGTYQTQNASYSNVRVTLHYQAPSKRYENYFIYITNKNASSENGGIQNAKQLDSLAMGDPYELSTRLGTSTVAVRNPFNTTVNTGNTYHQRILLFRNQYDLGQKDSLVTDSVTYHMFYARFRLQNDLSFKSYDYNFRDSQADSTNYSTYFNYQLPSSSTTLVTFRDRWSILSDEFNVISFPQRTNQSQFFRIGAGFQLLNGTFGDTLTTSGHFTNSYLQGEYRNRTRNQKWDIIAWGRMFLQGYNAGDYAARLHLLTNLSRKLGTLELGFENVNRSPSFVYDSRTDFPVSDKKNFNKENISKLTAAYINDPASLKISGSYYIISNFLYFDSFFEASQESTLFNVIDIRLEKSFKLSRYLNWYSEIDFQKVLGGGPVHVPFILTRNRLAFEGTFYKNLNLSTGLEIRYYTNYRTDNYSPFLGQYFYQNTFMTSNRPDVNAFFDFRIRTFKAFVHLDNLNTFDFSKYSFSKYNYVAPNYPNQGMWLRVGILWSFIN